MTNKIFNKGVAVVATIFAATMTSCTAEESTNVADAGTATAPIAAKTSVWPDLNPPGLDPAVEERVTAIMAKMTLEQKVGQTVQGDSNDLTAEDVRKYRLGSVLSGGNSAPGEEPYADAQGWLKAADAYFEASIDPNGVEIAIPIIWGIDAVHGHANLTGATIFPHNIGLGAANDPDLIEEIMQVTARELMVSGHDWTFAPTLAVPRDDRWGRSYEGFSEDPEIVKSYGGRIVEGLQGKHGTDGFFGPNTVISSAKHFVGDGGTTRGVDQGDTAISEAELARIHAAGYETAIESGVRTVMASFNSWNGEKLHGSDYLLNDVLKDKLGFNGFVIGDWNGHGQIPGCTNTDCPASFNAGVDMFMAPDSWKGVYESTLAAVKSGEITMERLDDAVRRILRVKVEAGIFEAVKPSARPLAGDESVMASAQHKEVARRSVRQSMVLLKNNDGLLPLDASKKIVVIGDGADSIAKQAGGWTLSWQGGGYVNSDFPNAESILSGFQSAVSAAGGEIITGDDIDPATVQADVVIAVYGEDPYAEFMGDRDNLDFVPTGFDTEVLAQYKAAGIPVVSVFLSGRPLWTNPELNNSDAFVAAFLPGSEGGGVGDVLFRTNPEFDFTGRLSFSWSKTAVEFDNNKGVEGYDPLFALGYGLSYDVAHDNMADLPEDSGIVDDGIMKGGTIFARGGTVAPWKGYLVSSDEGVLFAGTTANLSGLAATRVDHLAQEDAINLAFEQGDRGISFQPDNNDFDWAQAAAEGLALEFAFKSATDVALQLRFGCGGSLNCAVNESLTLPAGDWREVSVPLACMQEALSSADGAALLFGAETATAFGLGSIRLGQAADDAGDCQ